jgi:acyl-coenzyme A thioesterase PaaI-like protein
MTPEPLAAHHPNCMGCGPENPGSLGLRFFVDGDRVRARMRLDERHEGAPGFAHGGAVATALDDTIGTLLVVLRRPAVTAKLEVDYRKPAFLHRDFELEAWCERIDGRKLHLAGAMREAQGGSREKGRVSDLGEIVAESRALFLEVDLEHFARGGKDMPEVVKEHWRKGPPELPY